MYIFPWNNPWPEFQRKVSARGYSAEKSLSLIWSLVHITCMPLIAEADAVNAVVKWQSYSAQQEVYDSNAVFIFSILSAMAKESKELEKLNSKTRGR